MVDEAGFDALVGSEESRLSSRLYSERALVMSKGFVAYALSHQVAGLDDIIKWLYLSRTAEGPRLLEKIVEESRILLQQPVPEEERDFLPQGSLDQTPLVEQQRGRVNLSSGAKMLLQKHLTVLTRILSDN